MKFKVFAKEFFRKRRALVLAQELAPPSLKSDEIRFAKLLPYFAELQLDRVSVHKVDEFLDSLLIAGKSPATRNRYRALFHSFFKYAIRLGHCGTNPVAEISILSERLKKRAVDYWKTTGERDRYIKAAFRFAPVFGLGASLMLLGGCRIGEALAIQWDDIEWECDYVRIRKTLERHTRKIVHRTKGQRAGGQYQMILVPRLKQTLVRMKKGNASHDFLLQRLSYDSYSKAHYKIVEKAGLKRITLHDLRRTFACHAERAGFHRSEIGEMLGHETLSATEAYVKMDVSHLVSKAKRKRFGW